MPKRGLLITALIASIVAIVLVIKSTTSAAPVDRPHVFLLVLDEISASTIMNDKEEIDARRYPRLARLAGEATWYRNHTTTADSTVVAVPSLLSGQRPDEGKRSNYNYDHNLYRLLEDDYQIKNNSPSADLCRDCPRPSSSPTLGGTRFDMQVERSREHRLFAGSVKQIAPWDKPTLWFSHWLMPHEPWRFLPNGQQYALAPNRVLAAPGLVASNYWSRQQYPVALSQQRMILQSQFADYAIGLWLDKIKRLGLWEQSMIIIVADHGTGFMPGSYRRSASASSFSEIANVPMFVKYPGQSEGKISDRATTHLNILPTINRWTVDDPDYRGTTLDEAPRHAQVATRSALTDRNQVRPLADMTKERREMIERRDRIITPSSAYLQSFARPYIGRQVSPGTTSLKKAKITLLDRRAFVSSRSYSNNGVYLTAATEGLRPNEIILLAIDGEVVAAGKTFIEEKRQHRLVMIIDPQLLPPKQGRLSFYRASGNKIDRIKFRQPR